MITITELARKKVLEVAASQGREGDGLRLTVRNAGTSMAEFGLQFVSEEEVGADDVAVDVGDFKVYFEAENESFLKDATIDFIDRLHESGFKVDAPHALPPKPTGDLATRVQAVIDTKINPAVASHGGFVVLEGLQDNIAYLRFGGGCQGCGMINVTLKQGVEVAIKEEVPEIAGVMDVTDHANGTNPYYSPGK